MTLKGWVVAPEVGWLWGYFLKKGIDIRFRNGYNKTENMFTGKLYETFL